MGVTSPIRATDSWFVGEDQAFIYTITDATYAAVNITGWAIQWKMSLTQGGASALTKAATLTTPASGICTVTFLAADTIAVPAGNYFYTLSRTDAGFAAVLAYGNAVLQARPT